VPALPENNAPGFRGKWSIGFDLYSTRCKVKARDRFSWRVKHRFRLLGCVPDGQPDSPAGPPSQPDDPPDSPEPVEARVRQEHGAFVHRWQDIPYFFTMAWDIFACSPTILDLSQKIGGGL
jgi:hypothetical protein